MEARAPAVTTDGRVVKRAVDAAQAARIGVEAEVLSAAQMPGVVTLVAVEGDPERPCVVTARVDGIHLGRGLDLSVEEVAGVVAAVGTVLADLHDLGLVHGAVMASHVLVGPDGRPVLCGFGYGAGPEPLLSKRPRCQKVVATRPPPRGSTGLLIRRVRPGRAVACPDGKGTRRPWPIWGPTAPAGRQSRRP